MVGNCRPFPANLLPASWKEPQNHRAKEPQHYNAEDLQKNCKFLYVDLICLTKKITVMHVG